MKAQYPIFVVKANNQVKLIDYANNIYLINKGDVGTFQARPDYSVGITTNQNNNYPPILIDAIFNGAKIVFRPKFPVFQGDLKTLLLRKDVGKESEFTILKTIYPSVKINKYKF